MKAFTLILAVTLCCRSAKCFLLPSTSRMSMFQIYRHHASTSARHDVSRLHAETVDGDSIKEGSLMELDVVEYELLTADGKQGTSNGKVELASYIGDGKLCPLLSRESSGPDLFFYDEEADLVQIDGANCRIVRVLDQVFYSQRIVEDRIKNPHGEEAEDCFLVEDKLNPAIVLRVEHDEA